MCNLLCLMNGIAHLIRPCATERVSLGKEGEWQLILTMGTFEQLLQRSMPPAAAVGVSIRWTTRYCGIIGPGSQCLHRVELTFLLTD